MDFENTLDVFIPNDINIYAKNGTFHIPNFIQVYTTVKKDELYNRYCEARMFLKWSKMNCLDGWFETPQSTTTKKYITAYKKRICCEVSLGIYCSIVDICIAACWLIARYSEKNADDLIFIEEAKNIVNNDEEVYMRDFSKIKPNNPNVKILKNICQKLRYKPTTKFIFNENNPIKHRGVPYYVIEEKYRISNPVPITVNNNKIPTGYDDIRKNININNTRKKLYYFDNKVLYPFLKEYYKCLDRISKSLKDNSKV